MLLCFICTKEESINCDKYESKFCTKCISFHCSRMKCREDSGSFNFDKGFRFPQKIGNVAIDKKSGGQDKFIERFSRDEDFMRMKVVKKLKSPFARIDPLALLSPRDKLLINHYRDALGRPDPFRMDFFTLCAFDRILKP